MNWTTLYFAIAFLFKHLLGDFFFQSFWMWEGKRAPKNWVAPLLVHAGINAAFTLAAVSMLTQNGAAAAISAGIDFVLHAGIDRSKIYCERIVPGITATAIDQGLHGLTYLLIFFIFIYE